MKNNKFYVPDLTEFHIGFEYELIDHSSNNFGSDVSTCSWKKYTMLEKDIYNDEADTNLSVIAQYQRKGYCRVKYLDQIDMKELGWLFCNIDDYGYDVFSKTIEIGFNTGVKYYVYISPTNPGKIFIKWESYSSYNFVSGEIGMFIKNKNEFENFFNKLSIG